MAKLAAPPPPGFCPCGSQTTYVLCCGRYLDGNEIPATAEVLMRSRYTAYTLLRVAYLLATWHPTTRPERLELGDEESSNWLGLEVKRHTQPDDHHAVVEFVARYKVGGRAHRMHEVSRFTHAAGHWLYVDGEVKT